MILATLCYVKQGGRTLMLERRDSAGDVHQGKWNGLGGKLKPAETPEECVIREVKEESGLAIQDPELAGILTFPAFAKEEDWYVCVFVARKFTGELQSSEEGELHWIDDDKLCGLNLWEGDRHFLKWIDERKFFSGKFVYRGGKFVDHSVVFYS